MAHFSPLIQSTEERRSQIFCHGSENKSHSYTYIKNSQNGPHLEYSKYISELFKSIHLEKGLKDVKYCFTESHNERGIENTNGDENEEEKC